MRVCAENLWNVCGSEATSRPRSWKRCFASTTIERPSGVSSASDASCATSASSRRLDARRRMEHGRLPVAERDRAGLVEQQHVDVPGRLDSAARGRDDVGADHAIHARDADRRQQPADRRRNQAHEQRNEHRHRDDVALARRRDGIGRERRERRGREQEDDRQRREQDRERDLVRCAAALRALDHRDHAIQKALALAARDAHDEPVGQHACPARHGRKIAARLAQHRRRLARDGAFVDRGDALDHLAVGGDRVVHLDEHQIAAAQRTRFHHLIVTRALAEQPLGVHVPAHRAQRGRLCLAAPFGHGFGEVREQHREPQPRRDRQHESGSPASVTAPGQRCNADQRRQHAADVNDEHDGIADLHARIELRERAADRANDDRAIEEPAARWA